MIRRTVSIGGVGKPALASEITRRYPQFIRNAVATADYFRAKNPSPDGFRYCWNVGSWLIDSYFAQATKGDAAFLEKAIRAGDIVWHALPFTMESEIAGLDTFGSVDVTEEITLDLTGDNPRITDVRLGQKISV